MSRLATEHKADRAAKDNPHRKRKSVDAFAANNGVGVTRLNPNSKTLPPLSMGQQNKSTSAGPSGQQQAVFQGSLVAASQLGRATSQQQYGFEPPLGQSHAARKKFKFESAAANSGSQARTQSSGSKQTSGGRQTAPAKQRSGSRQSSDDGQTKTECASHHLASHQSTQQLATADTVTSAAPQPLASISEPTVTPQARQTRQAQQIHPEQQVNFPFRLVMPRTAHFAPGAVSSSWNGHAAAQPLVPTVTPAAPKLVTENGFASQPVVQQSTASLLTACQSERQQEECLPAVSVDGQNCMAALAEAAAAASEGCAASSSSHAHPDDDQDAAAILRDLQNDAGAPQHASQAGGEWRFALDASLSPFSLMCIRCCSPCDPDLSSQSSCLLLPDAQWASFQ